MTSKIVKVIIDHFRGISPASHGSLAYRKNSNAIWRGDIPDKYTRLLDLIPGERVLELGAAEGVLSLLIAKSKRKVFALEMNKGRHEEALRLQKFWRKKGMDVDRCEMVLGKIDDRLDLLKEVDTLVAVRSIYYLGDNLKDIFQTVGAHVDNVVLCGNKNRARMYSEANGKPDDKLGAFNYYASLPGMVTLLEDCGYTISKTVAQGDPIVAGVRTKGRGVSTLAVKTAR